MGDPGGIGRGDAPDDIAWRSTPKETAAYITDLLDGLALLAQRAELTSLAYLLSVAAREAREQSARQD